ncbi:MAG TPA: DNA polymerase III subunit delta [Firmicutes bacterium]|nr:DNA polymerase III subunit delta [Bacillota bacterium]
MVISDSGIDIIQEIGKGKSSGVYLLYGEEPFLRDETASKLADSLLEASIREFNLAIIDGASASLQDMINAVMALPVFSERRVTIIKEFDKLGATDAERLLKAASHMSSANILLLLAGPGPIREGTRKAVSKIGRVIEFKKLYEGEATSWLVRRAGSLGLKLSYPLAHKMVDSLGCDLRLLATELDKLATYLGKLSTRRVITSEEIEAIVAKSIGTTVFDLVDAIGKRDSVQALERLRSLISMKEEPIKILGGIVWQMRSVLQAKLLQQKKMPVQKMAAAMGKSLFATRKCLAQARNFMPIELENAIHAAFHCDLEIKTGSIPPQMALEKLVIALCSRSK